MKIIGVQKLINHYIFYVVLRRIKIIIKYIFLYFLFCDLPHHKNNKNKNFRFINYFVIIVVNVTF